MVSEFGPDTTLDELGLSERLAARMVSSWLPILDGFGTNTLQFDAERLRLSLHGESEHPGDAFKRGRLVSLLWMTNALFSLLPVMCAMAVPVSQGSPFVWPLVIVLSATALFGIVAATGSVDLIDETQLMDHTVPEQPDELDTLQERFVDGDLDRAEFEQKVERIMEQ